MRAAALLGFASGAAIVRMADVALPTSVIEWVTLLIALLGAYLAWRGKRV